MLKVNISQKYVYAYTRPVSHRYHDNRSEMHAVHDIYEKIWSISHLYYQAIRVLIKIIVILSQNNYLRF